MAVNRGSCISGYNPAFAEGAKCYSDQLKVSSVLSGNVISGDIVTAVAHGLGAVPKFVMVEPWLTKAQAASATLVSVRQCAASAATATNIYIVATGKGVKYKAFIML